MNIKVFDILSLYECLLKVYPQGVFGDVIPLVEIE